MKVWAHHIPYYDTISITCERINAPIPTSTSYFDRPPSIKTSFPRWRMLCFVSLRVPAARPAWCGSRRKVPPKVIRREGSYLELRLYWWRRRGYMMLGAIQREQGVDKNSQKRERRQCETLHLGSAGQT